MPPVATGTKHQIVEALIDQELSAADLAEQLSISPAAVRQHLAVLGGLGIVERRKVVTRPSRPTFLYRLSPEARAALPKRYDLLLRQVLAVVRDRYGRDQLESVMAASAERVAGGIRDRLAGVSEDERWELLLEWLEREFAWHAEAHRRGKRAELVIHQCPFQEVSAGEPEVCGIFFRSLLRAVYGDVPIEHVPHGVPPVCCRLILEGQDLR